jgi:hypothetical protein
MLFPYCWGSIEVVDFISLFIRSTRRSYQNRLLGLPSSSDLGAGLRGGAHEFLNLIALLI